MKRKQQPSETRVAGKTREERAAERKTRRGRLQIDPLEDRVAPSAIWGD
jgi:hypothetical protein